MHKHLHLNMLPRPYETADGVAQRLACWTHNPKILGSKQFNAIHVVLFIKFHVFCK